MIEVYFGKRIIHLTDEEESFYAHFEDRNQLKKMVDKFIDSDYEKLYIRVYQFYPTIFL